MTAKCGQIWPAFIAILLSGKYLTLVTSSSFNSLRAHHFRNLSSDHLNDCHFYHFFLFTFSGLLFGSSLEQTDRILPVILSHWHCNPVHSNYSGVHKSCLTQIQIVYVGAQSDRTLSSDYCVFMFSTEQQPCRHCNIFNSLHISPIYLWLFLYPVGRLDLDSTIHSARVLKVKLDLCARRPRQSLPLGLRLRMWGCAAWWSAGSMWTITTNIISFFRGSVMVYLNPPHITNRTKY